MRGLFLFGPGWRAFFYECLISENDAGQRMMCGTTQCRFCVVSQDYSFVLHRSAV